MERCWALVARYSLWLGCRVRFSANRPWHSPVISVIRDRLWQVNILGYNHHPGQLRFASSEVSKSRISFGWGKGGESHRCRMTAGTRFCDLGRMQTWVDPYDPIWHVIFRKSVVIFDYLLIRLVAMLMFSLCVCVCVNRSDCVHYSALVWRGSNHRRQRWTAGDQAAVAVLVSSWTRRPQLIVKRLVSRTHLFII